MKFFVPAATKRTAEDEYQKISAAVKDQFGWKNSDRRIYSLKYVHDRKRYHAAVGEIRIAGVPANRSAAIARVREVADAAKGVPVAGFSLGMVVTGVESLDEEPWSCRSVVTAAGLCQAAPR